MSENLVQEHSTVRLGRVKFEMSYVVDLDDPVMVSDAIECIVEDVYNAVKFDEIGTGCVKVEDAPDAEPTDIPDFLQVSGDADWYADDDEDNAPEGDFV